MLYEKKVIGLFTHNFRLLHPNSQKIEGIFNEGLRKVLNNQLKLYLSPTSQKFFFFIGSQNRFHLLISTSWFHYWLRRSPSLESELRSVVISAQYIVKKTMTQYKYKSRVKYYYYLHLLSFRLHMGNFMLHSLIVADTYVTVMRIT